MRLVRLRSSTLRGRGGSRSPPTEEASSATSSRTFEVKGLVRTARLRDFWNLAVAIICMVLVILRMLRTALRRLTIARALAIGREMNRGTNAERQVRADLTHPAAAKYDLQPQVKFKSLAIVALALLMIGA